MTVWHPAMPQEYRDSIGTQDAMTWANDVPDESVDMVLTDPPFGIDFHYSNGYEDDPTTYLDLLRWLIDTNNRVIRPGGLCFVFQAGPRLRETWPLFPLDSRIFVACKNFVQMRPSLAVQYSYDPVIFWQKQGKLLPSHHGRDYHVGNTANTNNRGAGEAHWHSCPRPLGTISYMVENFSPPNGVICDFFMGSGTTALAARMQGRHFIGCELDDETATRANARVAASPIPLPLNDNHEEQLSLAI